MNNTSLLTSIPGVTFVISDSYEKIAKESRLKVLDLVYAAQTSHIGSLLGCADIMAVLMEKVDFEKSFIHKESEF